MTQRRIIELEDDLDGGAADETMTFGLDGRRYEIDLSSQHAQDLRQALAPYVTAGRRTGARSSARAAPGAPKASDAAKIREWALANGYVVGRRGRITVEIQQAYEAAA